MAEAVSVWRQLYYISLAVTHEQPTLPACPASCSLRVDEGVGRGPWNDQLVETER